nr:uncharacterized protein LOC129267368 [Lytechinus pictus]
MSSGTRTQPYGTSYFERASSDNVPLFVGRLHGFVEVIVLQVCHVTVFECRLHLIDSIFPVKYYEKPLETNIQMSMVAEELEANATLLCGCKFDSESTFSVQWFRSINLDRYVQDGKALASWNRGDTESLPGFGMGDDVSLILYNVNLGDKGLFRCIVTLNDGLNSCKHDVILNIYANPDNPPMISYKRNPTGLNVTCSVDNVFPMKYPNFIMEKTGESENHYNENADGTFDTAVTNTFSLNYTTIQCAYSTLRVKSISSLQIELDINKHDPKPGDGIMTQTDMTSR